MTFTRFTSVLDEVYSEQEERYNRPKELTFGISFLDDAALGILPNDLVLIGARSGVGKTAVCCSIAVANIAQGKRVHFIALEAEPREIVRRLKYQILMRLFFADPNRPQIKPQFQKWMLGKYKGVLDSYEIEASKEFIENHRGLFTFYKSGQFDVNDMTKQVILCERETDLVIIDHVHYFDYDEKSENEAIKNIAKMVRTLTLENGIPIILVAHLRKKDRFNTDLAPGIEEFHGSSDLYKIATKVITLAPGPWSNDGRLRSFFRVVKNRFEGSVTRNIAEVTFNQREGKYEIGYRLGDIRDNRGEEFVELSSDYPDWAERALRPCGMPSDAISRRASPTLELKAWSTVSQRGQNGD